MSGKDRRPYLTAVALTQQLLDYCQDNLECRLEMICEIETPGGGTIYASDRNKYVGPTFYEALLVFPTIGRTVGEWLSPELQFSTLQLDLSNVDGRFNLYLPGGASFGGWIGKKVTVKLGLDESSPTYTTVFEGHITDVGGFKRNVKSITIIARDDYDRVNRSFPTDAMIELNYPKIEAKNVGKLFPVIYGDWTVNTEPSPASVPAFVVNGNDPLVTFKDKPVEISGPASPAEFTCIDHDFDNDDKINLTTSGTLPAPFLTATGYYVQVTGQDTFELALIPAGASINSTTTGTGEHRVVADPTEAHKDVELVISSRDLSFLDAEGIYLKKGDTYYGIPSSEITILAGNKAFMLLQNTATLWVASAAYLFDASDTFFVKVKGHDLGSYDDNLLWQARDILIEYGGLTMGEFSSNWAAYRDKAAPAQSSISTILSRVWVGEPQSAMTYALSMLEQVRLEAFIDRNLQIKINSLHFEDWDATPSHILRNWDVVEGTFQTSIDERNNFNAGQGVFNYLPDLNENAYSTAIYQNSAAITQVGKRIAKKLVFPNLYVQSDVLYQLIEFLRLASSTLEILTVSLTWRSLLKDIGEFANVQVQIGSSIFDEVPAMIREIGYDPQGLKLIVKLWSLMMVPFPGYIPGYAGSVGGYSASITEET